MGKRRKGKARRKRGKSSNEATGVDKAPAERTENAGKPASTRSAKAGAKKPAAPSSDKPVRLRSVFDLDLRSLAAMRVALGFLIVVDLVNRARAFTAHYTDFGVVPNRVLAELGPSFHPSLHALSGSGWFAALLFLIAGVFGLMLMVGYRTRVATVASWVLMVSLHSRNPWVLQGGDDMFRMLLFWGMFLPLGARWSIDSVMRGDGGGYRRPLIFTMATVALLAQVAFVYAFATASKVAHSVWFPEGMGVYYSLSVEQFTTRIGFLLLELPWLLKALSFATVALQAVVPLLLVLPVARDRIRAALVVLMIGWHVGFALTMHLGLFSWITVAMWLALAPPLLWRLLGDRLPRWRATAWAHRRWQRLASRLVERFIRSPGPDSPPPEAEPRRRLVDTAWMRAILAVLIVYSLWWNLWRADRVINRMPESVETIGRLLRFEQRWKMFSSPPRWSQWFAVVGVRAGGGEVDAFWDRPAVSYDKPELVSATFPNQRWRKYFNNIARGNEKPHRAHFAAYICRRWNAEHGGDDRITSVKLVRMRQATPRRPGLDPLPADQVVLGVYPCAAK